MYLFIFNEIAHAHSINQDGKGQMCVCVCVRGTEAERKKNYHKNSKIVGRFKPKKQILSTCPPWWTVRVSGDC